VARFVLTRLRVITHGRTATASIAMAAVIVAGCASAPSPRVPPGGISVGLERSPKSRRLRDVYRKDGERIDPVVLPEVMADDETAMALELAAERADGRASAAFLAGLSLDFLVAPGWSLAFRNDGRTLHETVPLTTAAVGVAALIATAVFIHVASNHRERAVRVFNASRAPPPLDPPPAPDAPICPIGADC
jgi:hypothetical protein